MVGSGVRRVAALGWVVRRAGEGRGQASLPLTTASRVPQTLLLCWRLPGAWRTGCSGCSASSPNHRP